MRRWGIAALLALIIMPLAAQEAQTRALRTTPAEALAYFESLRDADANGFLVGQFGGYGSAQSVTLAETHFNDASTLIGDCPAFTGWDLWNSDQTIAQSGDEAFAFWQMHPNLFYTLSAHIRNPFTGGKVDDVTGASRLHELLSTDTAAGRTYRGYLDEIAAQLQRFEDAGAVVLWRPLHEMNGGWFWWGAGSDADFIALWRDMHDYFTKVKGLTNLLWVYAPNARFTRFDTMYPGGDVVDLVGLDYYKPLAESGLNLNRVGEYDWLAATGKPMYLTEFGARPASGAGWNTLSYNHEATMQAARQYPALIGALYWEYVWRIGYRNEFVADFNQAVFMQDPLAATCSDLPDFLFDNEIGGGIPDPTATHDPALPTPTPTITPTATATPTPTATLTVPDGARLIPTTDDRIMVIEYQPPNGRRVYLQAVTTIPGVRRVMFYFGNTWKADDADAPYQFGRTGFIVPAGQEVRVLVVYNDADEFVEGRFTYTMHLMTNTPVPSATRLPPTLTPSATPVPPTPAPGGFDVIVCVAQAGQGAVLTDDTVTFDRTNCVIRP